MLFGPQNEPIPETEQESCLTTAELRMAKHERDVAVDGPGFGPTKAPNSSVASGTDRDAMSTETAVLVGPQGEKLYPPDGICPVCGQQFPEACSQPGADLSAQPGSTPDPEALREDDYIEEIDEPEDDEVFDGASPSEFELLS